MQGTGTPVRTHEEGLAHQYIRTGEGSVLKLLGIKEGLVLPVQGSGSLVPSGQ